MNAIYAFDIISYLDDAEVFYSTVGKNISRGWIGLNCPFCGDQSTHLGVNIDSKLFKCWICAERGGPAKLIKAIQNIPWYEAVNIIEKYTDWSQIEFVDYKPRAGQLKLPKEFVRITPDNTPQIVLDYLESRNFDLEEIKKRILFYSGPTGKFKYRLIIPILFNNTIVNFTGRDVTGKSDTKYKGCPNDEAGVPLNSLLYGIDGIYQNQNIVLVEGIFDQWRLGYGSIAIFGVNLTDEQALRLYQKKPSKITLLLDQDVKESAIKNIESKLWFAPVDTLFLSSAKDPADLSYQDAREIMEYIGE